MERVIPEYFDGATRHFRKWYQ